MEKKNIQNDHDHSIGNFRGTAHSNCNLIFQNPRFISIFVHYLSGYDDHLSIKEFGNEKKVIQLIPNNEKKYISYSKVLNYVHNF